jgi:hypothetical protein
MVPVTRWIVGNALLSVGLLWVAASWVVQSSFFADVSTGGGFSVLIAYVVIVVGVSFLVAEINATRPLVRHGVVVAPPERLRFSRPGIWLPCAVTAASAGGCIAAFVVARGS